jgi:hypothetical protein
MSNHIDKINITTPACSIENLRHPNYESCANCGHPKISHKNMTGNCGAFKDYGGFVGACNCNKFTTSNAGRPAGKET